MIHGLHFDVPAAAIVHRLEDRIAHHRARLGALQERLQRVRELARDIHDLDSDGPVPRGRSYRDAPAEEVTRDLRDTEERIALLAFMRDHVVEGETYRVSSTDLELLELGSERVELY